MFKRVRNVMSPSKRNKGAPPSQSSKSEEISKQKQSNTTLYNLQANDVICSKAQCASVRMEVLKLFPNKQIPSSQHKFFECDFAVSRYLIGAKMNYYNAAKNLASTLLWRESRGLLDDSTPEPNHLINSFVPVGLDRRKYVVIYSNHARAEFPTNLNAEIQFDHAFRVIETACNDALGIARTLWVIDFNGFGLKHICKKHIILGCAWFGTHNPERLGDLVLLNPPKIFMALWRFIHIFLDPDSAKRILVCKSEAEAVAYLNTYCSSDTTDWLIAASRMRPSVGGGYPPGTDFSLIEKTKWKGPPVPATLALTHEWLRASNTVSSPSSSPPSSSLSSPSSSSSSIFSSFGFDPGTERRAVKHSKDQVTTTVFFWVHTVISLTVFLYLSHAGLYLLAAFFNGSTFATTLLLCRKWQIPVLFISPTKVEVIKDRVKKNSAITSLFPPVSPR